METTIFTDGSALNNGGSSNKSRLCCGGWAFAVTQKGKILYCQYGGEIASSNQRMELTAILEAIRFISNSKYLKNNRQNVSIMSDSAYVINGINNLWFRNWMKNGWRTVKGNEVANKDLWTQTIEELLYLNELSLVRAGRIKMVERNRGGINFKFIKGHQGNTLHDFCDNIAGHEARIRMEELYGVQRSQ